MTVITPTLLDELPNEWRVTRWQGISTGDTIEALFMPMLAAEVIMHSKGTFAGGTELTIEGSNEDVSASFVGLRDPQGGQGEEIVQGVGTPWLHARDSGQYDRLRGRPS